MNPQVEKGISPSSMQQQHTVEYKDSPDTETSGNENKKRWL
jgi:hypothetical protein